MHEQCSLQNIKTIITEVNFLIEKLNIKLQK